MKLEVQHVLTPAFAQRRFFTHPPEPPGELLEQDPCAAVYVGKTRIFHTPYYWNYAVLTNPHIAVVGITGSGKSVFCKTLITRAYWVWGTSTLILDWSGEYVDWVTQAGGRVLSLGKKDSLNLLELGGMTPASRIRQVVQSLTLLTDLGQFPEQVRWTQYALERAFVDAGFTLDSPSGKKLPTLKNVVAVLQGLSTRRGVDPVEKRELEGALYRVSQLTGKGTDFFCRTSSLRLDDLLGRGLVCVDLSGLPSESLRSLGGLTLLQFAREKMRGQGVGHEKGLKQFILLDEAWKICQDHNGEETDPIAIVREGRKYQFGLIVASQNPTDVSKKIFSNVGTLFTFRVKFDPYLDYLQQTLCFSPRIRQWVQRQGVGQCVISHALASITPYAETFALERVDAEELACDYVISLNEGGTSMGESLRFEKSELLSELARMGVKPGVLAELSQSFERHHRHYGITALVMDLERSGLGRAPLTHFLKKAGLSDLVLAEVFARAESKKSGGAKRVDLSLEESKP